MVARDSPFVQALRDATAAHHDGEPMSVGRDGASDAVSFLRVGVPAVEFGPIGAGHHGPGEWVSVSSLATYRQALESFLRAIPERLVSSGPAPAAAQPRLEARKPPPEGDGTEPPKKKRYWWRFTLAAVLIVGVTAGATASSVLLFLDGVVDDLQPQRQHRRSRIRAERSRRRRTRRRSCCSAPTNAPAPNSRKNPGRSDTTMLLRLDPDKGLISVLSIPRDLKVEIPGYGTDKFNAAYSYGGPKLTLKVVKELTGLKINHVVNVDFLGFVRAVDAIGCVYVDVDRRYYHSNDGAAGVRTVFGNQHPARLPEALRQKSAAVRALPPHRHRHRPLRPPAELHQPGPPAGRPSAPC